MNAFEQQTERWKIAYLLFRRFKEICLEIDENDPSTPSRPLRRRKKEREKPEMITLLNTSILTNPGSYIMRSITLAQARELIRPKQIDPTGRVYDANDVCPVPYQSAIGHESTAAILTELLGVPVPVNRIEYRQEPETMAVVFKLKGRPPEGKILSREELEQIGFEFFSLYRVE